MTTAPLANLIAQTGGSFGSALAALAWSGVVIALLVGAVLLLKATRRKLTGASQAAIMTSGSALEELRRLRNTGQLSQEEFDVARVKLIARASARMAEAPGKVPAQSLHTRSTPAPGPSPGYPTDTPPEASPIDADNH